MSFKHFNFELTSTTDMCVAYWGYFLQNFGIDSGHFAPSIVAFFFLPIIFGLILMPDTGRLRMQTSWDKARTFVVFLFCHIRDICKMKLASCELCWGIHSPKAWQWTQAWRWCQSAWVGFLMWSQPCFERYGSFKLYNRFFSFPF